MSIRRGKNDYIQVGCVEPLCVHIECINRRPARRLYYVSITISRYYVNTTYDLTANISVSSLCRLRIQITEITRHFSARIAQVTSPTLFWMSVYISKTKHIFHTYIFQKTDLQRTLKPISQNSRMTTDLYNSISLCMYQSQTRQFHFHRYINLPSITIARTSTYDFDEAHSHIAFCEPNF
jgi:hypothetical protein